MFAVIETGGKQYTIKQGDTFVVDRLDENETRHTFDVLLLDNEGDTTVGTPLVEGANVVCEVVEHIRDDKVRVFKMKSKKHYRRTQGFRACQTRLRVVSVNA